MADHYGTIAGADTYHADRGNAAWAAAETSPDTARIAALVRASAWIDGRFRARFPGSRTEGRDQPLEWPRIDAKDNEGNELPSDETPAEVEKATYEAALRELASPGSLTPDFTLAGQIKREKVGPMETECSEVYSAADVRPCVGIVEDLLAPLIGPGGPILYGTTGRG